MAEMGNGYGSEFQLTRYLTEHEAKLDLSIKHTLGSERIEWVSCAPGASTSRNGKEWVGVDFLDPSHAARMSWRSFWPNRGPNWDAVGIVDFSARDGREWLLVERLTEKEVG